MNKYILFFFFFHFISFSQEISGTIIDFDSSEKLPYANITYLKVNKGDYSKEDGSFKLTLSNKDLITDSLLISFVGYQSKKISVKSLLNNHKTIKLKKDNQVLDEVILNVKKAKYSSENKIKRDKYFKKFSPSVQYGLENAVYIQNPKRIKGKVTALDFFIEKTDSDKSNYNATYFRVSFYDIDSITNQPSKPLIKTPILIKNTNQTQKISLNLEKYNVPFKVNGVFVGIETVKPNAIESNSKSTLTSPSLVMTYNDKMSTYYRYRGKKWNARDYKLKVNRLLKKAEYLYSTPLIQLKVKYIK